MSIVKETLAMLYLTPASISYLNQFLLSLLIAGYLLVRALRRRLWSRQDVFLLVFFASATVFSGLLFLEASLLPAERLFFIYPQNAVIAVLMIALLQFAYAFPELRPEHKLERRLALLFFCLYALLEAGFAAWRYALLAGNQVEFRLDWMDFGPVLGFFWIIFVFTRSLFQNWNITASRRFALIFLIPFGLSWLNLLNSFALVSMPFYHNSMSVGILFTIFLFALNYLSALPDQTTLMTKVSGFVLTAFLAVLGVIAWLVVPAHVENYTPSIREQISLRFSPTPAGGYLAQSIPFHYETEYGDKLPLTDSPLAQPLFALQGFDFEFFGRPYDEFWISNDGFIGFGQPDRLRYLKDFEYHFSSAPVILALFLDLNPDTSPGGIFLRQDADRLVVTYDRIPAYRRPENLYSFQVILYADHSFEFNFHTLPALEYYPNDRPDANPWATGIKPGISAYAQADLFDSALEIGPQGLIQDHYREFRAYLHTFIWPLALAVLASSLLFGFGLPLLLHFALTRPLEALLRGARAWNAGMLDVRIPVRFNDEIGYLTDSFNRLGGQLDLLVKNLEAQVARRTDELSKANAEMRKLFIAVQQSPSAIIITDPQNIIEYANPASLRSSGYSAAELIGQNPRILKSERTLDQVYDEMWNTLRAGETWRGELCNRKKNGEEYWEYTVIAPIRDEAGELTHYVAVKEDVTARILAEQALKESEKQYRNLFDLESDALFIIRNQDGRILEANRAAVNMYGFSLEELKRMYSQDLSADPQETRIMARPSAAMERALSMPLRMHRRKDEQIFPIEMTIRFITWKGQSVYVAAVRDVTERRERELELRRLVITDPLTGLYNRRHFFEESQKIFNRAKFKTEAIAIFMMDIDHFKRVNDTYGHAVGDVVLREVAQRIERVLRPMDLVARYGGEEFIALLSNMTCDGVCQVADRLLASVGAIPVEADGRQVSVTLSIGIAMFNPEFNSLDEFIEQADQSLYQAKQSGRNRWAVLQRAHEEG